MRIWNIVNGLDWPLFAGATQFGIGMSKVQSRCEL